MQSMYAISVITILCGTHLLTLAAPINSTTSNDSVSVAGTATKKPTLPTLSDAANAQIIKYDNANIGVTGYDFAFETSDGVSRKESATLKNIGTPNEAISVQGTVSWYSADGTQYTLNYLADENGFQPEGDHLPVAPEA